MKSCIRFSFLTILVTSQVTMTHTQEMLTFDVRELSNTDSYEWAPAQTAIIVCDMWDDHWCATATNRVGEMAPRMNAFIAAAREKGITIVHAPSSTMEFYQDHAQRKKIQEYPEVASSQMIEDWYYLEEEKEGKLPIDDTDGGCDDPASDCIHCEVWSRQIKSIDIFPEDLISDSGKEINNYFTREGITNVILVGVHINMCVLGRSFGIRSQIKQGRKVLLVRDLTDSMYNPAAEPKVTHAEGTELVITHVEKNWCPTITSDQLLKKIDN